MINVTAAAREKIQEGIGNYAEYVHITLADGTEFNLTNADLWEGGVACDHSIASAGKFQVGTAAIGACTITIYNFDETYTGYDFTDATVNVQLGIPLEGGTQELIQKGFYTVNSSDDNGTRIALKCYDNMCKFDADYADVTTEYPTTVLQAVKDICANCNMLLLTESFPGNNITLSARPNSETLTCRQVLAYIAQRICTNASVDERGRLRFSWPDMGVIGDDAEDTEGGIYDNANPYATGDSATGGEFNPWETESDTYGGTFAFSGGQTLEYSSFYSFERQTENVTITGIQVTEYGTGEGETERQSYLCGEEGYLLNIEGNPFIGVGEGQAAAAYIGAKVVGLTFRPSTFRTLSDPTVEVGDVYKATDRQGRSYYGICTSVNFKNGRATTVSCEAEPKLRNGAKRYSETQRLTETVQKTEEKIVIKLNAYELAQQMLGQLQANALGYFQTKETLPDGSTIEYQHDKPTLAESTIIYKKTIDAFTVSTDGGQTWNAGFDAQGNAVLNILNAIGINASWVRSGRLEVVDDDNNVLFYADKDTKEVFISADCVRLAASDNTTLQEALQSQIADTNSNLASTVSAVEQIISREAELEVTVEGITSEVSRISDLEGQIQEVQSSVTQSADALRAEFSTTVDEVETLTGYVQADANGLHVGRVGDASTVDIANNRISFNNDGSEVAYVASQKMHIKNVEVEERLDLGNFAFVPRANGNLSFLKVK